MIRIDWNEYKVYKKHSHLSENFEITLEFLKNYYHITSPFEIYDTLAYDDLGKMMLNKRNISNPEGLEPYLFKTRN